jgi:hypothetical protein
MSNRTTDFPSVAQSLDGSAGELSSVVEESSEAGDDHDVFEKTASSSRFKGVVFFLVLLAVGIIGWQQRHMISEAGDSASTTQKHEIAPKKTAYITVKKPAIATTPPVAITQESIEKPSSTDLLPEVAKKELKPSVDTLMPTDDVLSDANKAENDVKGTSTQAQADEIASLKARISDLKKSLTSSQEKNQQDRLMLKQYYLFSSRLLAGKNAETAYNHLVDIAPESLQEKLSFFAPMVRTGVADSSTLQQLFAQSVEASFSPKHITSNASAWQHIKHWFASLVTWRKVGAVQGRDDAAIIARAEVAMQQGDIADCLQELDALSVAHTAYFSDFMHQAQLYLDAQHRLKSIEDAL